MWPLILMALLGPGTELTHDCGYSIADGKPEHRWVAANWND